MKVKIRKDRSEFYSLTPDELAKIIEGYFEDCEVNKRPITLNSVALHCGANKDIFYNIKESRQKIGSEFKFIIEQVYDLMESYLAEKLLDGKNVVGCIFTLKANYQWTEKQSIDLNHTGEIKISFDE